MAIFHRSPTFVIASFAVLVLTISGCAQKDDSSSSSSTSSSTDTSVSVSSALSGSVTTVSSSSSRIAGRRTANATSYSVDQGVKALVSLYLMIDENYTYPVAKVKSADNGSYEVTTADVKDFLLDTTTHAAIETAYGSSMPSAVTSLSSSSSASELLAGFQALGPLRVRAIYTSGGKARAMTAMADPTKTDAVRVDPVIARAAEQIMGSLVTTIKTTISSISGLSDTLKSALISAVLTAVSETVVATLEEYKDTTTFELEEGSDVSDPEDLFDVSSSMSSTEIAAIDAELASSSEEVSDTLDTVINVSDTGKLADTLSDEEKGAIDKIADNASSSAASTVGAQDATAGKKIKVKGLRKLFLTLGFPVILDQQSDNTTVVAVALKVPPDVEESDLPGKATFKNRGIRHFLVKGSSSSSAPSDWSDAPELSDQVDNLTTSLSSYMMSGASNVVDHIALENDNKTALLSRVRTFHRLARKLEEGMPLVSKELVSWMADNDNKTVTLKDLATQVAGMAKWAQERIVFSSDGIPIFTGKTVAPSSGSTVKATELITSLTMPVGTSAKATAKSLTDNNSIFWVPYAAEALADEIMRKASTFDNASTRGSELLKIVPKTKSDYLSFLKGGNYTAFDNSTVDATPSPRYIDARASVAKGLVAALPDDAYSTSTQTKTLNGETELSGKASVFLITYMLQLQYPIDKAKGMLNTDENSGALLPNIENFKRLEFTSDPSVSEVAGAVMSETAPDDNVTHEYTSAKLRAAVQDNSTGLMKGMNSLQLAEFRQFDPSEMGMSAASTANISCTVSFYDGRSDFSGLSASILSVDSNGEFSTTSFTVSDSTGSGTSRSYTASSVNANQEYALRFAMSSYRNDLPDLYFYVDGYESNMNICGPDGFVIGPDVEDKPVPGMGLFAGSSSSNAEGLDLSNFTKPGSIFMLFPSDEPSKGTRDVMLTKSGSTFTLITGDNMSIAPVYNNSGTFSLSTGDNVTGMHSVLGQSLSAILGLSMSDSSLVLSPDSYGGLSDKIVLLKVSDSEYWLLELRFVDTNIGMMDLGFTQVTAQGRAEIPDAGFEQGPVDMSKAGNLDHYMLMFGDGLDVDGSSSSGKMQFPFSFTGSLNTSMDVDIQYAGDYFDENISSMSDMDQYWGDASSIPVRIDARGDVTLRSVRFKKQSRSYEVDNSSLTSLKNLEHNDLFGICISGTWEGSSSTCPQYVVRVVRTAPAGDMMANMQIELEVIQFQSSPTDKRLNILGETTDSDASKYPKFTVGGETAGIVYDGDYDGVPYIFDPNDEDPNMPGSGGGGIAAGGPGEGFHGSGVSLMLLNKYSYSTEGKTAKMTSDNSSIADPSRRILVRVEGVFPGDIKKMTLGSEKLSLKNKIFGCSPPEFNQYGMITSEYSCSVDNSTAEGNANIDKIEEVMSSFDELMYQIKLKKSVFSSGGALDVTGGSVKAGFTHKLHFRAPVGPDGNTLKCGSEDCPSMPPMEGKVKIRFPTTSDSIGPFENIKVKSGNDDAQDVKDASTADSGKSLRVSSSAVQNAGKYMLKVYCAGKEESGSFEPPYQMDFMLPPGTKQPSFDIDRGMLPGGRSCDFRTVAIGEDSIGNPIGVTVYKFSLSMSGGFGGGGPVDNEFKVTSSDNKVCWDNAGYRVNSGSNCDGKTELFTTAIGGSNPYTLGVTAASGISIQTESHGQPVASGSLTTGTGTGTVVVDSANDYCGVITGDPFTDSFECSSTTSPVTLLSYDGTTISKGGTVTIIKGQPDNNNDNTPDVIQSNFFGFGDLAVCTGALDNGSCPSSEKTFRIFVDRMTFDNTTEVYVHVEYEKSAGLSALTNGQFFRVADAGGGQPLDFDVRFVKSDKAKLAYFLPPPQMTLADGGTFQIDGVNIISRSGSAITFDNSTVSSVWDFMNGVSVTSAVTLSNNNFYEYDITVSSTSKNYKVMLNVDGSGNVSVEFFELHVGGGGTGGGHGGPGGDQMALLFAGDKLCTEGPNAWPQPSSCSSPATELLNVDSSGVITLNTGGGWSVTQDDSGYALSSGTRNLTSSDGYAFYKLKNSSSGMELEIEIGSPYFDGSTFKEVEIRVKQPFHDGGGSGGSGTSSSSTLTVTSSCPSGYGCESKTSSDGRANEHNIGSNETSWISVRMEAFGDFMPSLSEIMQYSPDGQGGPPDWTCTSDASVQTLSSLDIGGTTGRSAIVRENCSASYTTSTAMWISFYEQNHYVNIAVSDVGTLTALTSGSWPSVLSGLTFGSQ